VLRLLGPSRDSELAQLARKSPLVKQMLTLEATNGAWLPPSLQPYAKLAQGDLTGALSCAEAGERARVTRLVGASKGASPAQIEAALALADDQAIDSGTIFASVGLRLKHHKDPTALIARLEEFASAEEQDALRAFLQPDKLVSKSEAAREAASQLSLSTRAHAYVMAAVQLGERTPEAWLTTVRSALFANERPHL
jgi:hypothetical protein